MRRAGRFACRICGVQGLLLIRLQECMDVLAAWRPINQVTFLHKHGCRNLKVTHLALLQTYDRWKTRVLVGGWHASS